MESGRFVCNFYYNEFHWLCAILYVYERAIISLNAAGILSK